MKIPSQISLENNGQYCLNCFSNKIKRVFKNGLTFYHCDSCKKNLERSLVIDNKINWWINKSTEEYWHESVGVFLFNASNQVLFFKRVIFPFALTIPAGHLDSGEDPKTAVVRELKEETKISIEVKNVFLFSEEDVIGDKCRRGADNHKWHLYVSKIKHNQNIAINDEGNEPIWLTLNEALEQKLTYPVKLFIEKYGNKLLEKAGD